MNEPTHSEATMIVLAQEGNADAFGELYQLHLDAISRYIQRRVNEIDEVENLTQTVFVKAWQAITRYQPTNSQRNLEEGDCIELAEDGCTLSLEWFVDNEVDQIRVLVAPDRGEPLADKK